MPEDEWVEAGLVDPVAADADDRRALLAWLEEREFTLDELVEAERWNNLPSAVADRRLRPPPTLTREDVAERTGLSPEQVDRAWLAAGFPPPTPGVATFVEDDLVLFGVLPAAIELFGEDTLLAFTRVMGASMARIAEAADTMFVADVEGPQRASGVSSLELAQTIDEATAMLVELPTILAPLFRRHAVAAVERSRAARTGRGARGFTGPDRVRIAVGFADLVGFTSIAQRHDPRHVAALVGRFEQVADERAVAAGARIVKAIGDAVMVVGLDPLAVVDVMAGIADDVAAEPDLHGVRAAVAAGEALARDGDYVGPTVNLAARATKEAPPGGIVVNDAVAGLLAAAGRPAAPLEARRLRGIDDPVVLWLVSRGEPRPFTWRP